MLLASITACESGPTTPDGQVDLDRLFAPAQPAEIQTVRSQWASRSPMVQGAQLVSVEPLFIGAAGVAEAGVFAHQVDGNTHYGFVVVPPAARDRDLPVLVYNHGGDGGISLTELAIVVAALGGRAGEVIIVAPSFRSEQLEAGGQIYQSTGDPSPWDRDVDDAIALLDLALTGVPAADPDRVVALGISRGGGVALLMGIRDPRIDAVIEIAGPTDFFGEYVRGVIEEAIDGNPRDLPGLNTLNETFIQPLVNGAVTSDQVRLELARRSAVLFAESLPPVQVHHGTADDVVAVSQATALREALDALPARTFDEVYLYEGAGHDPFAMTGLGDRIGAFLDRYLTL